VTGRQGRRRKKLLGGLKGGKNRIMEIERRSIRTHCAENEFWKRLWTCRETDCGMNGHYEIIWETI
jgi:hypothetical protein